MNEAAEPSGDDAAGQQGEGGAEREGEADDRQITSIVDDVGRVIDIAIPVRSVVPLNLRNIEFVRAVGAMDLVVGVGDSVADEPEYWPDLDPDVQTTGSQGEPNYEAIAALNPDVVIIPSNGAWEEAADRLEPFGIEVVVLTGWDQVKHEHTVSTMGVLFGRRAEADAVNAFYHRYRDMLDDRLADVGPVSLYLEKDGAFDTAVPGSGWHDMVVQGGGANIFEDITVATEVGAAAGSVHTFPIEPEAVLERRPEVIVKLTSARYAPPPEEGALEQRRDELLSRPGWDTLPAVEGGDVHVLTGFVGDVCSKIIGSLYIATWIHPELFEDVDPHEVMQEWIEDFQGVPFPEPERYVSASDPTS